MVDGDFKDLARKTIADKVLRDKVFNFAKNPKNNAYQRGLSSMFYKFFDKKLLVEQLKMKIFLVKKKLKNYTNKSLEHLIKKVDSPFIENIWEADHADMKLISKFNKGFKFLLSVIDIYSKYAWVIPLKDKIGSTITNAFQKVLDGSNRKPNKICVDKSSKLHNRSMKSWLEKNATEMHSIHNEGKSVVAKRFIRNL